MSDIIVAVYGRFDKLAKAPKMWAATKEGFMAQVALLLEFVGKVKPVSSIVRSSLFPELAPCKAWEIRSKTIGPRTSSKRLDVTCLVSQIDGNL